MRDVFHLDLSGGKLIHWGNCLEPLFSIEDDAEEVVVRVDLPGVKKEDIELYVSEDEVEVNAKMKFSYRHEGWVKLKREVKFKYFHKLIHLPAKVDASKTKAHLKHGILEIHFKKKKSGHRIQVE